MTTQSTEFDAIWASRVRVSPTWIWRVTDCIYRGEKDRRTVYPRALHLCPQAAQGRVSGCGRRPLKTSKLTRALACNLSPSLVGAVYRTGLRECSPICGYFFLPFFFLIGGRPRVAGGSPNIARHHVANDLPDFRQCVWTFFNSSSVTTIPIRGITVF